MTTPVFDGPLFSPDVVILFTTDLRKDGQAILDISQRKFF